MIENLHRLESILGYSFRRPEILERAVTHSSAANEKKDSQPHMITSRWSFSAIRW